MEKQSRELPPDPPVTVRDIAPPSINAADHIAVRKVDAAKVKIKIGGGKPAPRPDDAGELTQHAIRVLHMQQHALAVGGIERSVRKR